MEDGEYKCYACNGTKYTNVPVKSIFFYECLIKCPICKGAGKLDWISNIIKPRTDGKLEVDIKIKPVKPVEIIKLDFVIGKEGVIK